MTTEVPLLQTAFFLNKKVALDRLCTALKEIVDSEQGELGAVTFAAESMLTFTLDGPGELIRQGAIWSMVDERSMHLLETLHEHGVGYELIITDGDDDDAEVLEIIDSTEIIL